MELGLRPHLYFPKIFSGFLLGGGGGLGRGGTLSFSILGGRGGEIGGGVGEEWCGRLKERGVWVVDLLFPRPFSSDEFVDGGLGFVGEGGELGEGGEGWGEVFGRWREF